MAEVIMVILGKVDGIPVIWSEALPAGSAVRLEGQIIKLWDILQERDFYRTTRVFGDFDQVTNCGEFSWAKAGDLWLAHGDPADPGDIVVIKSKGGKQALALLTRRFPLSAHRIIRSGHSPKGWTPYRLTSKKAWDNYRNSR